MRETRRLLLIRSPAPHARGGLTHPARDDTDAAIDGLRYGRVDVGVGHVDVCKEAEYEEASDEPHHSLRYFLLGRPK